MKIALVVLASLILTACASEGAPSEPPPHRVPYLASTWHTASDRVWVGPQYWANRLQDWSIEDGRLHMRRSALPYRTLHVVTARLAPGTGTLACAARMGCARTDGTPLPPDAAVGFLIGAGPAGLDYRSASLVQSAPGPEGGWFAGIDGDGHLFIQDFSVAEDSGDARSPSALDADWRGDVVLKLDLGRANSGDWLLWLSAHDVETGNHLKSWGRLIGATEEGPAGNVALVAHPGSAKQDAHFWFDDWTLTGDKLEVHTDRTVGPILSAQHTLSRGAMHMTAQLMPVSEQDPQVVTLQVRESREWKNVATAPVVVPGYTATFRIEDWRWRRDLRYRLVYAMPDGAGGVVEHEWTGRVRRDPVKKDEIVLAAFTGNHNVRHGFGRKDYPWNEEALWFPHADITKNVAYHEPDLLFFSGDQLYEGASPTRAEKKDQPELDYLYKWYLWCWAFRDLTRDIPCIAIPDDHDVYQGNIWGQGGRPTKVDNQGGYVMPADWVKMVERTQTSNLPDPFHDEPVAQGIGRYYTSLRVGGVDFAILEDRKFKSGCAELVKHDGPRPDHIDDPTFDMSQADVPGAKLLGDEQLAFLAHWARDWNGVTMKAALSQTVFANVATLHGGGLDRLRADLDSNGWPQSGRNRALAALRVPSAFMVGGDQHLSTIVHHGIDTWDDAGWSFCVPSIANFYPRAWVPLTPGENRAPGAPEFTGRHLDGFNNHVTVHAATNPGAPQGREPVALHDKMPGYGIVRFAKKAGTITMECWPRAANPRRDEQYPGWPRTIGQYDNDGREVKAWLPTIRVKGIESPVVQVVDANSGELIYVRRASVPELRLGVYHAGMYDVLVGEPESDRWKLLTGLNTGQDDAIDVSL